MSATISLQPSTIRTTPQRGRVHGSAAATPARPVRPAPRSRRVSEATYRRRRAVVGTALAVFVAVGAVTAYDVLAGSGGVPASAAESLPARTTITARPGDTLWAIAGRHRGDVSMIHYLDKLVELNGGPSIQAGQQVVLP